MLLSEVYEYKAHVAPKSTNKEDLITSMDLLRENTNFGVELDRNYVRDRYKRLQEAFIGEKKQDVKISSVRGELRKADEFLRMVSEERDDLMLEHAKNRNDMKSREMKKMAASECLEHNKSNIGS